MVKEDKYIENRFGKVQPFKAPKGYLDNFADQFMAQLPDQAAKTVKTQHGVWFRMRPAMIAAASVLAVALRLLFILQSLLRANRNKCSPQISNQKAA
ncbi:MAG: hypothetical protein ACLRV7_04815 [Hoylesella buccalis]